MTSLRRSKTPSLRAVCHLVATKAPNGLAAKYIFDEMGINYATAMSELSGQPGHKWGADNVLPLMNATDSDEPVEFLAEERGGVFVKLPEVKIAIEDINKGIAEDLKEHSEKMLVAAEALMDGKVTRQEYEDFKKENREHIAASMRLELLMKQAAESGGQI